MAMGSRSDAVVGFDQLTQINSRSWVGDTLQEQGSEAKMRKIRNVWVVVADGAKARFYAPNDDVTGFEAAGPVIALSKDAKLRSRELKSDRPGRSLGSSRTGIRHAIEPKHDHHKMEKHRFAVALAEALDRALSAGVFDDLVIVAPRRSLGEMRTLMPDRVKARVQEELAKDLTRNSADELWEKLAPTIVPLATRRRKRAA
jgi:protein required for attachment to host cells